MDWKIVIFVFLVALYPSIARAQARADDTAKPDIGTLDTTLTQEFQRATVGLASDDPKVRAIAAWKLGEMREDAALAVPVLLPLLREGWSGGNHIHVCKDEKSGEIVTGIVNPPLNGFDTSPRASFAARDALIKIGKPAVEMLIEGLNDEDVYYRLFIAEILGEIGDQRALQGLVKTLDTGEGNLQIRASQAIVKLNHPDATKVLIETLLAKSECSRQGAAVTLGLLRSVESIDALDAALGDTDHNVRKCAAEALAKIYDPKSSQCGQVVELLLTALQDEDWYVRRWTAAALREVKTRAVVNALIDRVADEVEHMVVRTTSADSLGFLGSPNAVPSLVCFMNLPDHQGYEHAKTSAAEALGKIAIELKKNEVENKGLISDILDEVIASLRAGDDTHHWKVFQTLAPLKDPKLTPYLLLYISDEHDNCREICAFALGEMGDTQALQPLIERLQDDYWVVQKNAAEALGKIGDKNAIEPLKKYISQCENVQCREAAVAALNLLQKIERQSGETPSS